MKNNKICFIIYGTNEFLCQESLYYILNLHIPEGVEMDYMLIRDPDSVYEAYNAGMNESDADYKVYVNENVFITDADFVVNLMNAFENNTNVGMIGALGYHKPALYDTSEKKEEMSRIGCIIFEGKDKGTQIGSFECDMEYGLKEVTLLDYNIVATAVDTDWFKDMDAAKVMSEKSRALNDMGYKSAVMLTGRPWCLYDNDIMTT
jgi:hypothetical protein